MIYTHITGSIFTSTKLRDMRKPVAETKRAVNVWVKRVASTALPADCHACTCHIHNYYQTWIDCHTCVTNNIPFIDMVVIDIILHFYYIIKLMHYHIKWHIYW